MNKFTNKRSASEKVMNCIPSPIVLMMFALVDKERAKGTKLNNVQEFSLRLLDNGRWGITHSQGAPNAFSNEYSTAAKHRELKEGVIYIIDNGIKTYMCYSDECEDTVTGHKAS